MKKIDNVFIGIFLGLVAAVLGFILFGLWWTKDFNWGLNYYYNQIFLEMNVMKIGTISILAQMLLFYVFYQKNYVMASRGVMVSIFAVMIFLVLRSF